MLHKLSINQREVGSIFNITSLTKNCGSCNWLRPNLSLCLALPCCGTLPYVILFELCELQFYQSNQVPLAFILITYFSLSSNLVNFAWLADESSVVNLFPSGTLANSFGILTLCKHVAVITIFQSWCIALMPICQPKDYRGKWDRKRNLQEHLIMNTLFQPLAHSTTFNQYLLFLVFSSLNCMFVVFYGVPPYIYQYQNINPERRKYGSR